MVDKLDVMDKRDKWLEGNVKILGAWRNKGWPIARTC